MTDRTFAEALAALDLQTQSDGFAAVDHGDRAAVELKAPEGNWSLASIYLRRVTIQEVRHRLEQQGLLPQHTLILSDHIGDRLAGALRRDGLQYLDRDGNAFLSLPGLRVDVRGRQRSGTGGALPALDGNLFSRRRSQVVFVLLAWPELVQRPLRAVAESAGVSLGLAQQTLQLLTERGYIAERGADAWLQYRRLQDQWIVNYPETLQRYLLRAMYAGTSEEPTFVDADGPISISGEYAARDVLKPSTLTLYAASDLRQTIRVNRWRADAAPNVFVRDRFWKDPSGSDARVSYAPPLLVYADLLGSDDPRQRDAAAQYWARHAAP